MPCFIEERIIMSLTKEIDCQNCGNICTIHYEENPNDEDIMYCPYCGLELEDDLKNFIDEDDESDPF